MPKNTGAIGVSMCGMYGFKSSKAVGPYPLTKTQCEACFKLVAQLCCIFAIVAIFVVLDFEFAVYHLAIFVY